MYKLSRLTPNYLNVSVTFICVNVAEWLFVLFCTLWISFQCDCLNISRLPEWLFGFPRRHRRGVLTHLRQARCFRRNEGDFHAHSKRIFKESKLDWTAARRYPACEQRDPNQRSNSRTAQDQMWPCNCFCEGRHRPVLNTLRGVYGNVKSRRAHLPVSSASIGCPWNITQPFLIGM